MSVLPLDAAVSQSYLAEVWNKTPSLPFLAGAKSLLCISVSCSKGQKCPEASGGCSSQGLSRPVQLSHFSHGEETPASRCAEGGTGFNCHQASCVKCQYLYLMLVAQYNYKYIGN